MTVSKSECPLTQIPDFTLHYFGVKGAASVTLIVLEQFGVEYAVKNYGMDFAKWTEFKPQTPTGMMPIMEFSDGAMIAESGACMRTAAAKAGALGDGLDYARSEQLIGMSADLTKIVAPNHPTIMTVKSFTEDPSKVSAWKEEHLPKALDKLKSFEKLLLKEGDRFTSTGLTLGEFELWFKLYQLKKGAMSGILEDVPCLKSFYERMSAEQGPTKFDKGQTKFGEIVDYFVPMP